MNNQVGDSGSGEPLVSAKKSLKIPKG